MAGTRKEQVCGANKKNGKNKNIKEKNKICLKYSHFFTQRAEVDRKAKKKKYRKTQNYYEHEDLKQFLENFVFHFQSERFFFRFNSVSC